MRIGKESKNWIRAAVIGVVLGPTAVSAEFPRPLETAGRLYGVCWGDGYHACASSGVRPGADLPPKSYSTSYGSRSHVKPTGIVHRIGATYYDRFDAANARACDAPKCDSGPCDCGPCDSGTVLVPDGSQVRQTPDVMSPTGAKSSTIAATRQDTRPQPALKPTDKPEAAKTTSPKADANIKLTQPLTLTPQARKYPTRPAPPLQRQRSNAIPVASKQQSLEFSTPGNEFAGAGGWGQATSDRPKSKPVRTATPGAIDLIHPGNAPSIPERLAFSGNPLSTSTPNMVVPAPRESTQSDSPQVALVPTPLSAIAPSYVAAPYVGSESTEDIGFETIAAKTTEQAPVSPMRLGTSMEQEPAPTTAIKSVAAVKRPTRLGDGGAGVQFNPFASRPLVEMAKRSGMASEGVIFQPSKGSLK